MKKTYTDPDIGKCDDCGSVDGRRFRRYRVATMVDGESARLQVWLCRECHVETPVGSFPDDIEKFLGVEDSP